MDTALRQLIREQYPFPIAHAHKKTLACLDADAHALKCVVQTAEATVQFLALVMLAQLHHDLAHQQAPALGQRGLKLRDDLRTPSFGKWHGIVRDLLKQYHTQRHLLVMPELFEVYFQPGRGARLTQQPVVQQAIEPLITLRNQFHHPGIPEALIPARTEAGLRCLEQLLERVQFLATYALAFVQRIEVRHNGTAAPHFRHDLVHMQGCFSIFERQRWDSDAHLREGRLALLTATATGRTLFLDPFLACAEELPIPGVFDVFLLNGIEQRRGRYLSAQFGQELGTDHPTWAHGADYLEALGAFTELLRRAPTTEAEVALEPTGPALHATDVERAGPSTEAVFQAQYQSVAQARSPVSPYKFLDYFEPEDADLFCGRDQEIRQLQRKFHAARLLILHGESGTGKTSLIRAGLLPRLSPESYVPVYVRALQEPARAIKEAMVRQLGVDQRHLDLPLTQFLEVETAHLSKTVVVILDQFEEFFLRLPLEVRRLFHQELGACVAAAHLDVHFIIALRDDYFSALAEFQDAIPDLFTHEMRLGRLTQAQALAAAVEPVKRVGWSIDEALVAEVLLPQLDEGEQGIEPPLLQIVCDALYQQAQDAGRTSIGAEEYAAVGDVRQALGRYLDTTLRQFGAQQPQVRAVLKALVTTEGTKRASFVDELTARLQSTGLALTEATVERDFLRKLVQARLVRVEDVEGRARYELAHEFLVQQIGTWIAESERELTKVLELIDRAYEAYRATGLLLEPAALALIAPFQDELVVPSAQQGFLDLSRQTARRRRRGLWLRVGALLLLVGLGVGGFFGMQLYRSNAQLQASNQQLEEKSQAAEMQAQQAQQRLAALYTEQGRQELLGGSPSKAAVYLSAAYQSGATGPALRMLLADAMRPLDAQSASLEGHTDRVVAAQFSPDGSRVVTASRDATAKVWDSATGRLLATLEGHTAAVWAAQFSPDGSRVVTAGDTTAKVWDSATGRLLVALEGHTYRVVAAQFSPDGSRVVTASEDGTAKVWDSATGRLLATLKGHTSEVRRAQFSPDGSRVVTASGDATAKVWDSATGRLLATLEGHTAAVWAAQFSPDGSRVVTAGGDATAKVWDSATGRLLVALEGHTKWVAAAQFSPDGSRVVTAGDTTAKVWDSATGRLLATLKGHTWGVSVAQFSPDGSRVVTVGGDTTAKVWDSATGRLLVALEGHTEWVVAAQFSPDGSRVVTASGDATAKVWDSATGRLLATLKGHTSEVRRAQFSPDGSRVVTASGDATAKVWDSATGRLLAALEGHTEQVEAAQFSPDGSRVVTASGDTTAKVWDSATGRLLAALEGHTKRVAAAQFSPDGSRVVTASEDKTAKVWDSATGRLLATLEGHTLGVEAAQFSPDGSRVVTAGGDETAKVWDSYLETRTPHDIAALVGCRAIWRLDGERLVPTTPDATACAPRSPAR